MLNIRQRTLEKIQASFAQQQQRVHQVDNLLQQTKQEIQRLFAPIHQPDIDPIVAQQTFRYIQHLKHQVTTISDVLKREEQLLAHVREQMRQAHVAKKSLDKLKDKQRDDYMAWREKQESKEIEDIVIMRQNRAKK